MCIQTQLSILNGSESFVRLLPHYLVKNVG